ncbi:MAG: hypothetical protein NTX61_16065, partial [Bacteroidetes bacterium]|nr:hypothetical protein [Bacteroidota bacterium]
KILNAGAGFSSYLWSTGATTQTITINSPGTYWVDAMKWGCMASDTVHVTLGPAPVVNLGNDTMVCVGTQVTFDAGTCSGCTYQWMNLVTGLPVGSNQTLTTGQAGIYGVVVTNPPGCTGSDIVQLATNLTPTVTTNPLAKTICSGNTTNILLTSTLPGSSFTWTATGSSPFVTGYSPGNGTIIDQLLTNTNSSDETVTYAITPYMENCAGSMVDYLVTVHPAVLVNISISASDNTICAGTQVTYSATPTNGGSTPAYQWQVNGGGVFPNAATMSYTPANGDVVTCVLTSSSTTCVSNNPATSNSITMTVNPNLPVSVLISASQNPYCAGAPVTFSATPTNGGTNPGYQWKVNGGGVWPNAPTLVYTPANGDQVLCILTSNIACPIGNPATSNTISMTENNVNPVSIVISTPVTTLCSGTSVTFTATPSNGGTSPQYQWKVNGINDGTNSYTFGYIPANGDIVSCALTSNLACATGNPATSNTITMTVNPNLPVSVVITASDNTVCSGTTVTFSATPTNGGTTPVYQWRVNGGGVWPNASTMFYTPANGDIVSCILNSNVTCPTGNPATSNTITMTINPNLPVSINITASINPVCSGIPVTYSATPTNGGATPGYQWHVNGGGVWPNTPTISYTPTNGDLVSCILTSNATCATGNPANSNIITMNVAASPVVSFTRCNDSITTTNAQPFRLKGGIPLGGTYSGPGVTNGIFYPAIAGVGSHQITYTYTNVALCSASAIVTIVTQS